jgi:hypothetical protein
VGDEDGEARGYGAAHRTLRAQYARLVDAGKAVCARCELPSPRCLAAKLRVSEA